MSPNLGLGREVAQGVYSIQGRFGLGDPAWLDPVFSVAVVLFSLLVALVFHRLVFPLILRITRSTPTELDSRLVQAARRPLTLAIVVLGVYLAITVPLDLSQGGQDAVDTIVVLLAIVLGVVATASLVSALFGWYIENVATQTRGTLDDRLMPLFRRVAVVLVYGLGALLLLDKLNINISPLIAGLGLGGLAVALALQPTLSNLFAGTYVMTEGVISPGDYIQLENGLAGYVMDVGWRSTRIRTFYNTLVVVPNARFADTIITNYMAPLPPVNVFLTCGVSYDSDLYRVEQVCREVMDEVVHTDPNAIPDFGSYFGFESFSDSNVDFWLFVQANDRLASFDLRTALMQRLHRRFREEGIVINYPMRTLQLPREWTPQMAGELRVGRFRRAWDRRPSRTRGRAPQRPRARYRRLDVHPPPLGGGEGEGEGPPS